ncbi:hypothetical protein [Sphingomonas turrisvirgatae]|uniref:Uncharacterized protein n=1 Tax=Sphingomonas turrisvirgatae TaxID=1888892 RepID=A0A1E3M136_9SPHN|nr:hypothetical protein [Sphingomonas turrisvirgatae]ODP38770.1 hypothetical protein BFL28_13295 [Sphingomonas turrisvirgatae]
MDPAPNSDPSIKVKPLPPLAPPLRAGDYLWRPWYAKAWWIAIPLYWLPAGTSLGPMLEPYYKSGYGAVTNILFMPLTAAVILGVGYVRTALARGEVVTYWYNEELDAYRLGKLPRSTNETDPKSEYFWMNRRNHDW